MGRTRTLDSHASRLRRKLNHSPGAAFVLAAWGSAAGWSQPQADHSAVLRATVAATFVKQDDKPEELKTQLEGIAARLDRIERALAERDSD
jgi:hypothetical protein